MKSTIISFLLIGISNLLLAQTTLYTQELVPKDPYFTDRSRQLIPIDFDNDPSIEFLILDFNGNVFVQYQDPQDPLHFFDRQAITSPISIHEIHQAIDVDADGLEDIIVRERITYELGWIKNTGNGLGNFYSFGNSEIFQTIRDIDQDGDLDFGVRDGWFENTNGAGTNWSNHSFQINQSPYTYRMPDLNTDGYPDLLFFDADEDILVSYFNDGNGDWINETILFTSSVSSGSPPYVLGDFDMDNDIDFYLTSNNELNIFINNGAGQFSMEILDHLSISIDSRVLDFDMDGDLDIVPIGYSNGNMDIFWYENTGVGSFELITQPVSENFFYSSELPEGGVLDMDQDGDLDFLISDTDDAYSASWIRNNNNQGLDYSLHIIEAAPKTAEILVCDVDTDGFEDIIVSSHDDIYTSTGQLMWYRNIDGNGTFQSPEVISWNNNDYGYLLKADLDNNDTEDLILLEKPSNQLFWLPKLQGQAAYGEKIFISYVQNDKDILVTGDFDEDGKTDIVASLNGGNIKLFHNFEATGTFEETTIATSLGQLNDLTAGDFNGNGHLDLIFAPYNDPVFYLPNEGNGSWGTAVSITDAPTGFPEIEAADLDSDNDTDIIISADNILYWIENINGTAFVTHVLGDPVYSSNILLKIIDIDGDSDLDILPFNSSDDVVYFENRGSGVFQERIYGSFTANVFKDADLGDINGDGTPDIVHSSFYYGIQIHYNLIGFPTVQGKCFFDENENGQLDIGEVGLSNFQLNSSPDGLYSYSTNDGEYNFYLNGGTHTITPIVDPPWVLTTDFTSYEVSISDTSATEPFLFGFSPSEDILSTDIYGSSEPTRCGFDVDFYINYLNPGTQVNDGFVKFTLNPLFTYNTASPLPDSIDGNCFYWNYENQYPYQNDQIVLNLTMPGVDYIGETFYMPATTNVTDSTGQIIFSDAFRYVAFINCSYDPNDKLVLPDLPGEENYTLPSDTLIYTVRFQNTGTDTAFTVRILDQLDASLDWSTCKPVGSSHPVQMFRSEDGLLEFLFEDILLPDSNVNEANSHGFVQYTVELNEGLAELTVIENTADIYFDFNPAIVTNTTVNTIIYQLPILETSSLSPQCHSDSTGFISISPTGLPPYTYLWNTGDTTAMIDQLPAGEYSVTVQDDNGNSNSTTVTLSTPEPLSLMVETSPEQGNSNNGTATVMVEGGTPGYTYIWNTTPPQLTMNAVGLSAGTYTVTITDMNNCTISSEAVIDFIDSTNDLEAEVLSIYPNPSTGDIFIEVALPNTAEVMIELFNELGQILLSRSYFNESKINLQKTDLPSGIYFISLLVDDQWIGQRVFIDASKK